MRSPFGFLGRLTLRLRITLAFVAAGAVLAVTLTLGTYYSVRTFLHDQRIRSTTRQSIFVLQFAREFMSTSPGRAEELVSLLQTRGGFEAMVTVGGDWYSTELSLTPKAVPGGLRSMVEEEKLGYQMTRLDAARSVAFGAPLPPRGVNLYLYFGLSDLDQTMSLLARVLAATGIGVVLLAAALAQPISRRILHPLAAVSSAAQHVAAGLLETRVEAEGGDEVAAMAASFNRMARALQNMIDRERRFVAGVSHELRTPLAALQTTSEVLVAHRDELSPRAREAADLVAQDIDNLRRLVAELMEVSEIDSGKAVLRWEEIELRAFVVAAVLRWRQPVGVEGPAITVVTDKVRLERVVGNLVDNAYQHGDGKDVRVTLRTAGDEVYVAVADRGPGIAPDDIGYLFDRFYKADRSRSRDRGGIGLGLAIAQETARLLGGSVSVDSRLGEGSTFTVRLPLDPRKGEER